MMQTIKTLWQRLTGSQAQTATGTQTARDTRSLDELARDEIRRSGCGCSRYSARDFYWEHASSNLANTAAAYLAAANHGLFSYCPGTGSSTTSSNNAVIKSALGAAKLYVKEAALYFDRPKAYDNARKAVEFAAKVMSDAQSHLDETAAEMIPEFMEGATLLGENYPELALKLIGTLEYYAAHPTKEVLNELASQYAKGALAKITHSAGDSREHFERLTSLDNQLNTPNNTLHTWLRTGHGAALRATMAREDAGTALAQKAAHYLQTGEDGWHVKETQLMADKAKAYEPIKQFEAAMQTKQDALKSIIQLKARANTSIASTAVDAAYAKALAVVNQDKATLDSMKATHAAEYDPQLTKCQQSVTSWNERKDRTVRAIEQRTLTHDAYDSLMHDLRADAYAEKMMDKAMEAAKDIAKDAKRQPVRY